MKKIWKYEANNIHTLAGYTVFLCNGAWRVKNPYGSMYVHPYMSLATAKRFVEKKLGY